MFDKKVGMALLLSLALVACDGDGYGSDDGGGDTGGGDTGGGGGGDTGGGNDTTPVNLTIGTGEGGSFQEGALTISLETLSAGGSTEIRVNVVDENSNNALYTAETVSVDFSSQCSSITPARASFSPATATGQGTVSTTYTAEGCRGEDTVTARVSTGSGTATAAGTITVQGIEVGSITGAQPETSTIGILGFGTANRPTTTRVPFVVRDLLGNPVSNQEVTFNIENPIGGVQLTKDEGTTNSAGEVYAIAQSGTVNTTFKVSATTEILDSLGDPTGTFISTENPYDITVNSGLPMSHWLTFGPETFNPEEAWGKFGIDVALSLIVSDRTGGPAAEGSMFSLKTSAGQIVGENGGPVESCVVVGGRCSLTWTSANPWPEDGGVRVLAFTRGDEYFIDENGNGAYDEGEYFCPLPEPYLDSNNDDDHDLGENFVDVNGDGDWDNVEASFINCWSRLNFRTNTADAIATGVYADGTGTTKYRGSSCTQAARDNGHCDQLTYLSLDLGLILSRPFLSITGPANVNIAGNSSTETYTVSDDAGNIPAAGTGISVSCEEVDATVTNPADGSVENTYRNPGTGYDFAIRFSLSDAGVSPGLCEIEIGTAIYEVTVTF